MAHEVETMMYAKEVPWHGLGEYVGDQPLLAEEAIVKAGLDWGVEKRPVFSMREDNSFAEIPEWFAVTRDSDQKALGLVQGRYVPLQNKDAFGFMDAVAGSMRLVRYHTAGALQGGKRIWLLAELLDMSIAPVKGDETKPYLLLANGHDGRYMLRCLFTSVRVVCQNTLNMAMGKDGADGIAIRHSGDMKDKVQEAQRVLGLARTSYAAYEDKGRILAGRQVNTAAWSDFLDELVPLPEPPTKPGRAKAVREELTALFETGPGSDIAGVRGTAWGALQAVTNFTTHHRGTRGAGDDAGKAREKRLEATWFGSGNALNQEALRILIDA